MSKLTHIRFQISFDEIMHSAIWWSYTQNKLLSFRLKDCWNLPLSCQTSVQDLLILDHWSCHMAIGIFLFLLISHPKQTCDTMKATGSHWGHFIILLLWTLTCCGCVEILSILLSGRQFTLLYCLVTVWIYNVFTDIWNRAIKMWGYVSWHLIAE